MPATTPAKSRRLFAIWGSLAPARVADDAASFAFPIAVDAASTAAPEAGALPLSFVIGPNRSEVIAQTGRAPMVKMSRVIPPTPVAAPWNGSVAARGFVGL